MDAFKNKYPHAKDVEWELKGEYEVADFDYDRKELEAWFQKSGQWVMTVTELRYSDLPEEVKNGFKSGPYGSRRVDDVEKVEKKVRKS